MLELSSILFIITMPLYRFRALSLHICYYLKNFIVVALIAASIFTILLSPAYAFSNQDLNQSAALIAPEPNFKIGIYTRPDGKQSRVGYAKEGDRVTVLEQVGSNEGYTWDRVRFDDAPKSRTAEGWIRSDYISFQSQNSRHTNLNQDKAQNFNQDRGYSSNRQNYQGNDQNHRQQSNFSKETDSSITGKILNLFKKS